MDASYLKRQYGITLDEYNAIWEAQGRKCAVCGRLEPKRIEVDHDHRLKGRAAVRGLLCGGRYQGCNRKLGRIDQVEWLEGALKYISNPPARKLLA